MLGQRSQLTEELADMQLVDPSAGESLAHRSSTAPHHPVAK